MSTQRTQRRLLEEVPIVFKGSVEVLNISALLYCVLGIFSDPIVTFAILLMHRCDVIQIYQIQSNRGLSVPFWSSFSRCKDALTP